MSEPKVRLSMVIPGATMLSSQDCEKMSKEEAYTSCTVSIKVSHKEGKKIKWKFENLHINVRNNRPARQNISIPKEAYEYMISAREVPSTKIRKIWSNMSKTKRLEYHLANIAEYFNAISWNYAILDD